MAKTARERQTIPALPDDLVLWEILVRLRATALLRCRAVCRSWRRLTSAADFLLAHHGRQPSLPLVAFDAEFRFPASTLDVFDLRRSPAERRAVLRVHDYNRRGDFLLHASCDGLLLMSRTVDGRFFICNPATRQRTELPTSFTGVEFVGMYLHSSSGEYRVLYWKWWDKILNGSAVYYVLTVGSSAEPRCIGLPVASPSVEQFVMVGLMYVRNRPPAKLRSCLHWGQWSLKNELIVFDTVAESFRSLLSPITSYDCARSRVLEMDGVLAISHLDAAESLVKLWLLQDYELEVWSLKYRIELPVAQLKSIADNSSFNALVVSDMGDVLVYFDNNVNLFHCDCNGNLLQEYTLDRAITRPVVHWFKQSLVRHTFFERN